MWFVGLVVGAFLGGALGHGGGAFVGAVLGFVVGLLLGAMRGKGKVGESAAAPASYLGSEQRLTTLEAQVAWLHDETVRLRRELAELRGEVPAEPPAPAATETMPEPTAAPAIFIDETPTQPGIDLPASGAEKPAKGPELPESWQRPAPGVDLETVGPSLWQRLLSGNLLAKIGVVLLFFGVASALRLAADYGFLPVSLRLLMGAVAGVAMVAFGWARARREAYRMFGIAVQGGGFAILYLIVYFMLARYGTLGQTPAFFLFALLGVGCVAMAAAQEGVFLAAFGLAGAFLAPVLAAGGSGDPLPLFAYLTLLNAFIVGVSWFRAWRVLNVVGLVGTLALGLAWATEHYSLDHQSVVQGFLLLFWGLYSLTPVAMAWARAPGRAGWSDGTLIFGAPLLGFALQSQLVADRYELAWAALGAGLYYGALWGLLFVRGVEAGRLLERAQLGLSLVFLTLAVPLGFGVQVTAAFWALEGVAVLWFGVAQGRRLAMATGCLLQVAAGAYFLYALPEMSPGAPVFNDACLGMGLIAAAGYVSARLLRSAAGAAAVPALAWAAAWWLGAGFREIHHLAPLAQEGALDLLWVVLSVLFLEVQGRSAGWTAARRFTLLLLPALWLAAMETLARSGHMLGGLMLVALPIGVAAHYWLLARQENDEVVFSPGLQHLGVFWLGVVLVSTELGWLARRLAPGSGYWNRLALAAGPLLGLWQVRLGCRREVFPFALRPQLYGGLGCLLPAVILAGWLVVGNLVESGGRSGLPYLPVLNPFDLLQLAALGALYGWLRDFEDSPWTASAPKALGVGLFLWITALAARIAHQWGGVPFEADDLWRSSLLQAMVTFLWTILAIGAMIQAARIGRRRLWQGGFALLAVVGAKLMLVDLSNAGTVVWTASLIGVALLVLAAGYFAPAPPVEDSKEEVAS